MDFSVKIFKMDEEKLKAFAHITIDNQYAVNGFRVIEGSNGLFVAMPDVKRNNGEFKDVFFPITKQARAELIEAILSEYDKQV